MWNLANKKFGGAIYDFNVIHCPFNHAIDPGSAETKLKDTWGLYHKYMRRLFNELYRFIHTSTGRYKPMEAYAE